MQREQESESSMNVTTRTPRGVLFPRLFVGMRSLAMAMLVFLVAAAGSAAELQMRWKFSPGEKLRYRFQQESETTSSGAGKPTTISLAMAMELTWAVGEVDVSGEASVVQTIDTLKVTMKADRQDPLTYDSTIKAPPTGPVKEIGDAVAPLIGAGCRLKISPLGEIQGVEKTPALEQALEKAEAGDLFSGEGVTRMLRHALTLLPEKAAEPGSSWESSRTLPTPFGDLKLTDIHTYTGPEDRDGKTLHRITTRSSIAAEQGKAPRNRPGSWKEVDQTGTAWFDTTRGRCAASEVVQRIVTEQPLRDTPVRIVTTSKLAITLLESP